MNPDVSQAMSDQLAVFQHATNWKSTILRHVAPHLGPDVLEVGAGIGGTTRFLCDGGQRRWLCLEPDPVMHAQLAQRIGGGELPACCADRLGDVRSLGEGERFDAVLYVDVLEHILDDAAELRDAAKLLKPGGRLVVLSPAYQFLYTNFDAVIGHHRRYTVSTLRRVLPAGLDTAKLHYLDSVGFFASLGNRLFLRQAMPDLRQIMVWDRLLVPLSRFVDPLLRYRAGKTVLYVGRRPEGT